MDGRSIALLMVIDYPPMQPLSISARVLVYCPPIRAMNHGSDKAAAGRRSILFVMGYYYALGALFGWLGI